MRNYAQHNAFLAGIRLARYEAIATIDDDLQHPPDKIGRLLDKVGDGHEVVYGTLAIEQHGLGRNLAWQITKLALQGAMGAAKARMVSAFHAFRTSLREAFADYRSRLVSFDVLLTWGTSRFAAVPVLHRSRAKAPATIPSVNCWPTR